MTLPPPSAPPAPSLAAPRDAPSCPLCGQPNDCAPARSGRFDVDCWCRTVQIRPAVLAQVPEPARGMACLCRHCATGAPDRGTSD